MKKTTLSSVKMRNNLPVALLKAFSPGMLKIKLENTQQMHCGEQSNLDMKYFYIGWR